MTILVGVNGPDEFKTEQACWCRGGTAVFWMFTATTGFILTVYAELKQNFKIILN